MKQKHINFLFSIQFIVIYWKILELYFREYTKLSMKADMLILRRIIHKFHRVDLRTTSCFENQSLLKKYLDNTKSSGQ